MGRSLDVALVRRWYRTGLDALGQAREEIDALNVYPVPDGDTGTNLYLTVEAAVRSAESLLSEGGAGPEADDLAAVVRAAARGALLGARGNSGVILSQLLRGAAEELAAASAAHADGLVPGDLAAALSRAADLGYAAVAEPVEGTMLTVAREAAQVAVAAAGAGCGLVEVATRTAEAARVALARTPEQLDVLRRSGVVDAGGRGLTVLYDAFEQVVTGRRGAVSPPVGPLAAPGTATGVDDAVAAAHADHAPDGPVFEVMYLLEALDEAVPGLRAALAPLGDSLVVVGGDGLWNVHVHVDDVGAAIEAGLVAGRPYRIRVTHFAGRLAAQHALRARRAARAVVAVAAGDGLAALFAAAGATVVRTRPGARPSTGELLEAIAATGSDEVVVLPNDPHVVPAAQAAAGEAGASGVRVAVLPTTAQVQGMAALAVHDAGRGFDADVVAMTTAAGFTRHGGVTVAAREAVTSAGVCRPGDVLGAVGGDFAIIADSPLAAAREVLDRLLAPGGELVTVVSGADADPELVPGLTTALAASHPQLDVVVHDGGQPRYLLLLGVE